MPAMSRHPVFAALLLATAGVTAQPAAAQWIASGRWGSDTNWRYVTPGTWMVLGAQVGRNDLSVSAEAENHDGRLTLWCRPDMPGGGLVFGNYLGDLLQRPDGAADPAQAVALVIDERPFEIALDYHPQARHWTAASVLDPGFLDAFGWGSRMDLRNGAGETVARFRLNASGAARAALRGSCGI